MPLTKAEQAELEAIQAEKQARSAAPLNQALAQSDGLTPEEQMELEAIQVEKAERNKGLGEKALDVVAGIGQAYDKYSGAGASRTALQTLARGDGVGKALESAANQYGKEGAPSGQDVARSFGVSDQPILPEAVSDVLKSVPGAGIIPATARAIGQSAPTRSGTVGFLVDLFADPFAILPVGKIVKETGAFGKTAAKGAGSAALKGSAKVLEAVAGAERVAEASRIGRAAGQIAENTLEAAMKRLRPTVAEDAGQLAKVLQKNGVIKAGEALPEALEFGQNSTLANKALNVMEGPGGEKKRDAFFKFIGKIDNSVYDHVRKISGGAPIDAISAGNTIIEGYNKGLDRFFKQMDVSYRQVAENLPNLRLSDKAVYKINGQLNEAERAAMKAVKGYGSAPAEGREILRAIRSIRSSWQRPDQLASMIDELQNLGKAAYSKGPQVFQSAPVNQKEFGKLYRMVRDAVNETLSSHDPVLGEMLKKNNKLFTEFFEDQKGLAGYLAKEPAPERVFKKLIESGDSKNIEALTRMLTPQELDAVRGAYLETLVKRTKGGLIDYEATINGLKSGKNYPIIKTLFGNDKRLGDVTEILSVGKRIGKRYLNPSGTDTAGRYRKIFEELINGAADEGSLEAMKEVARGNTRRAAEKAAKGASKTPEVLDKGGKVIPNAFNSQKINRSLKGAQIYSNQRGGLGSLFSDDEQRRKERRPARK